MYKEKVSKTVSRSRVDKSIKARDLEVMWDDVIGLEQSRRVYEARRA